MERPERAGTSRRPSGRRREVSRLPVGSRSPSPTRASIAMASKCISVGLLLAAETFVMSLWFALAAVLPEMAREADLAPGDKPS